MSVRRAKTSIIFNTILLISNLFMALLGFPFNLVVVFVNLWAIKAQCKILLKAIELDDGSDDVY